MFLVTNENMGLCLCMNKDNTNNEKNRGIEKKNNVKIAKMRRKGKESKKKKK